MSQSFANEYKCGCIMHGMAGFIRRCAGQVSRSMSGRMRPQEDGAVKRHANAMESGDTRQTWDLAGILP